MKLDGGGTGKPFSIREQVNGGRKIVSLTCCLTSRTASTMNGCAI